MRPSTRTSCGRCSGRRPRGPGTSCRSTATRAPTTRSSSWRPVPPGRPRAAPDSHAAVALGAAHRGRRPRPRPPAGRRRRGSHDPRSPTAVRGAGDDADARAVARAVVSSSLVKAAAHGKDPNWGRIAGAAGNARRPRRRPSSRRPASTPDDGGGAGRSSRPRSTPTGCASRSPATSCSMARRAARSSSTAPRRGPRWTPRSSLIELDLGLGDGIGEAFGCDLTEAYVIENSEYTT